MRSRPGTGRSGPVSRLRGQPQCPQPGGLLFPGRTLGRDDDLGFPLGALVALRIHFRPGHSSVLRFLHISTEVVGPLGHLPTSRMPGQFGADDYK